MSEYSLTSLQNMYGQSGRFHLWILLQGQTLSTRIEYFWEFRLPDSARGELFKSFRLP